LAQPAGAAGAGAGIGVETRSLAPFDRVRTEGAFTVEIAAGRAQRVTLSADPHLLERVNTRVEDGTLIVGMRPGTNPFAGRPHVAVEVPKLRGYTNTGAGDVTIDGLNGAPLDLKNEGAATIRAAGRAGTLSIALDGTGTIDTTALDARDVDVANNGMGRVDVRASGSLTMNVNGVGEIRYTGNPTTVAKNVNGIGRIDRM
jgi:hypothetical protein